MNISPALQRALREIPTEDLVAAVWAQKNELLRRGLDECGLPMPMLKAMVDMAMEPLLVPLRPHHECACPRARQFHFPECGLAEKIKDAARREVVPR